MDKERSRFVRFINSNKFFFLIILLILGWFFWFQVRPEIVLNNCLESAEVRYLNYWTKNCQRLGTEEPDCSLPREIADEVEAFKKQKIDYCFQRFKLLK